MLIIEQLRQDSLAARKDRTDPIKVSLLSTLIGEAVKIGKDAGNRESNDAEVSAVIKKFVKNLQEVAKLGSIDQKLQAEHELKILTGYLPKQLTSDELGAIITASLVTSTTPNFGLVMKTLKANHDGLYDGAMAKAVFESLVTSNHKV